MEYTDQLEVDLRAALAHVRRETGKSALVQWAEIARLAFTGTHLAPNDYYLYRLYDDALHDRAAKRRFVGDRRRPDVNRKVIHAGWFALAEDKLLSAALLERHGFPTPAVRAVYHPSRWHDGAESLASRSALAAWLRTTDALPLFAKPIWGLRSRGVAWIEHRDPDRDELVLRGGQRVGTEAFVASLERALVPLPGVSDATRGYVFQDVVRQHPEVVRRCGESVGCVRLIAALETGRPSLLTAAWKIAAPGNVADSFRRRGNLLAALDGEKGTVTRVVVRDGVEERELADNPHTGERLLGWSLPGFAEAREQVLRGARLLPEVRLQGWDVAIGPDGPVVVEVNPGSAFSLAQLATGRGFWTEEFEAFVARATRENPTRPRGLRRLAPTGHPLGRLHGLWRLVRRVATRRRPAGSGGGSCAS
jgi:hypothetical protein